MSHKVSLESSLQRQTILVASNLDSGIFSMKRAKCQTCGPSDTEYDSALGHVVCLGCGQVLEQNAMVSELTFTESAGGAVLADGFTLKVGQARAKSKTPFVGAPGLRMHQDSSEQTRERGHAAIERAGNMQGIQMGPPDLSRRVAASFDRRLLTATLALKVGAGGRGFA